MSRSLLLLTFLLAAPAAAAPASDLKDPFRPAPADHRDPPPASDVLRDPFAREPAAEPVRDPPSDLRDPFAGPAPTGDLDTSSDLRNPWARAPVVQRPAGHRPKDPAPASDLRNPWASKSSKAASKPRRGSVSGDLRDPFAPAVQRPRKAR